MSAKFGARRIQAFLAALRETGNQTIAAERAKVSRSWVQLHRSSDAGFRRLCDEAVQEAKAALRQARALGRAQGGRDSCEPPRGWGFLDGEELVVRGTGGAGGGKRVQIARSRLKQWSPRVEERFLETLAATCNVRAACAEVGLTPASAYNHRKRWQRFAERWDEAVETGYVQIEMGLIEAAGNLFSEDEPVEAGPIRGMTADLAIHLLAMHKNPPRRKGGRPRLGPPAFDIEDVRASILRKVEAIERHDPQRLARDREEWARRRGSGKPTGSRLVPRSELVADRVSAFDPLRTRAVDHCHIAGWRPPARERDSK